MINTSVFSLMKEEDKGLHYLPEKVFAELKKTTGSDFVITIMHHAPEWYLDSQKHELEKIIFDKSSIVFYGHEHYSNNKELSNDDFQGNVLIQCGGALSESEDWSHGSFFLGVLDTESLEYQQQQMNWNPDNQLYFMVKEKTYSLTKKTSTACIFSPSQQFLEELKNDENFTQTKDFRDFFVFPRIRADDISGKTSKELVSFDGLKNELYEKKGIVLNGDYSSGKTTLLKYLFLASERLSSITYQSLSNAVKDLGYTIICFTRGLNDNNVETLISEFHLHDLIKTSNGFIFSSGDYRLLFVNSDLSQNEKTIVLAHEIGHIVCKHVHTDQGIGFYVQDEYEANEFAHYLLNPSVSQKTAAWILFLCPVNSKVKYTPYFFSTAFPYRRNSRAYGPTRRYQTGF